MAITITDQPAAPQCSGSQWDVADYGQLIELVGHVMLGRAQHAADIIAGAEARPPIAAPALKARLKAELLLPTGADTAHRDGLLFETISWVAAAIQAGPHEAISAPHRKATQQGADNVRVTFDPDLRQLVEATVYEYKCTKHPRRRFKREVLPSFQEYIAGDRDDQLAQQVAALLGKFNLSMDEHNAAYERLILERPLAFQAALTVQPGPLGTKKCVKLFKNFEDLGLSIDARRGDTFPVLDIQSWFSAFAVDLWNWIDANV